MHTSIPTPHRINVGDEPIIGSQPDLERLATLLRAAQADEVDERLGEELERAVSVPSTEIPPDIVSMNSRVTFVDVATSAASTVLLVYPHDADAANGRLSLFARWAPPCSVLPSDSRSPETFGTAAPAPSG